MTVFIVVGGEIDFEGVFSTQENAEKFIQQKDKPWLEIVEVKVDDKIQLPV